MWHDQAEIIVTNPPFSKFRAFMDAIDHKQFLVIGPENAISYRCIFERILKGNLWLGATYPRVFWWKGHIAMFGNICWFTNMKHNARRCPIALTETFDPELYPALDNVDAIHVPRVRDIPADYNGLMAVPVSFLRRHDPMQFELVGSDDTLQVPKGRAYLNGKRLYARIYIRRR